jgi:hypothetical protein
MDKRTTAAVSLALAVFLLVFAAFQYFGLGSNNFLEIYLGVAMIAFVNGLRLRRQL